MKDLPPDQVEGTNKSDASLTRRLGIYRELNSNLEAKSHIHNFFKDLIGEENCMLLDNPEMTTDQEKTLNQMRAKLEQNGKPCCLNLITDADNRFLANIERQAKKEARRPDTERQSSSHSRSQA